jgi:hypothetical protein
MVVEGELVSQIDGSQTKKIQVKKNDIQRFNVNYTKYVKELHLNTRLLIPFKTYT